MSERTRKRAALLCLIIIGMLCISLFVTISIPSMREIGFTGAGFLLVILGLHLIIFRRENADFWRRDNRAFWGKSTVGNLLEPQYTPAITALGGIGAIVVGIVLLAASFSD
jgi:hypothetical protein